MAKMLIVGGVVLAVVGVALLAGGRIGLGRLPGDVAIGRGNTRFYFPIVTCIVLSVVMTLVLRLFNR